jgi:hypothetical protein
LLELGSSEGCDLVAVSDHFVEDGVCFLKPGGVAFEETWVDCWADEQDYGGDEDGF